jgi:hypothetical protein
VALTRQRESAQVFVARETAPDVAELARQMARDETRSASLAWAAREETADPQRTLRDDARADRVGPEWADRAMTREDAARLISPAYAKAAEAAAETTRQAQHADKVHAYWQRREKQARHGGERRWRAMNVAQRLAYRSGLYRDAEMAHSEGDANRASTVLDKLGIKRATLRDRLAYQERVAARELEAVRPAAERELAMRQERGREARTVLRTQREQEIERERALGWEHEWSLSRGWSR